MATLTSANVEYTAEQLSKTANISAETLASWGLTTATDTLTVSELAEKAATDAQAKSALEKIVTQNAQAVANGEITATNIALTASESGATLATGAFTTAIKANISAMWTWMTTTPVGWLTLIVAGVFAAVKAYDALTISVEEQKEKMEDSVSAYNDAKTELENITTELTNQEQAMDGLLKKDKLTYAEKGQLKELEKITEQLRIQKDLAEKDEEKEKKESAYEAAKTYEKQFGKYDFSEAAIEEYQNAADASMNNDILVQDTNNIPALIAAYKQYEKLLSQAYVNKDADNIDWFKTSLEEGKETIFSTTKDLQEQQSAMSDYYATLENLPYDSLTADQKKVVDSYTAISNAIELVYKELDPNTWNEMQVNSVFSSDGVEKTKDELVEMAKEGTLDESTIQSYKNLNAALEKTNMFLSDGQSAASAFCDQMYALAGADNQNAQDAQKLADTYRKTINRFPTNESITSQDVAEAKAAVQEEYDKIHNWELDSYADQIKDGTIQSKYGNVDMDNRQIIDWNLDNIEKWKDQLSDIKYYDKNGNFIDSYYDQLKESAEKGESNIDTVFGDMMDHIEGYGDISSLAFSHVVNNDDGTFEFLGQKTAEEYIYGILDEAKKDGDLSIDHILELDKQGDKNAEIYDAQGKKIGQSYIHGIIAGFNSNSEDISKLMHMSGKYGGVQIAQRDERKVESQYGNNEQNKIKNFLDENGISDNQELLDEFNQVTEGITNADEAMLKWKIHQEQAAESFSTAWNDLKTLSESSDDSTDKEDKAAKALYKSLSDLADKGELTVDTFRKVDGAENYFDSLGISAGQAVNQINQLSDKNSQVSAMRKNIKAISEALESKQTDGFATADDFAGFDATIKGLNSWKEFTTLLGDAKSSMEDCQTAANNLATEYVNSNEVICQLDDSTADYFRTQMTSMGVSNADAVVEQRLAYLHAQQAEGLQECTNASLEYNGQKITAANYSDFLANATANEIGALANEAVQSGNSANALSVLAVKKAIANGTTLSTAGDIQNLADLATAGSELGALLNRLAQLKKGFTHGEPSDAVAAETAMISRRIKALIGGGSHVNVTTTPSGGTTGTGTSGTGSSSSTKKTPFDHLSDYASKFFDWIEVRLDRLQKKIDSNISKAESRLNDKRYSSATANYMSAISGTYTKLHNTQRGRKEYLSTANDYLNKAVSLGVISSSFAKKIKSRVADGSINISKYSSDIQTVITTYKDWIDKAKDCTTAMQTLHDSLRTYAEDLKKVSDAQRDATVSMAETKQTIATGGVQNTSTAKNSALNYNNLVLDTKNKAYSTATRSATKNVNQLAGSANYGINTAKKGSKKYNTALSNIKGYIKKRVVIPSSLLAIVAKNNPTLYNRLYMYNLGIENLKTAREEYITAYSANSAEKYNNIADKYKNLDDATNDAMDLYNSKSSNSVYAKNKNSYLDKQKSGYGSIVNRDVSERNKYASAVSSYKKIMSKSARGTSLSALSIKSRSVVRKCVNTAKSYARHNKDIPDSIIGKLSEYVTKGYISSSFLYACINYNNTLESYNQAKAQAEIDKQTQIAQRAEIASQKFSNIATEYDNKRHTYEQIATELNNKMSILEAKGNGASDVWYQRLYTNEQKTNSNLVSKRKDLIDSLNKSVKNGDIQKYSTEWYNLRSQIDDVTNSIDESTKSLQEYQNQMEQIKWDRIDEGAQKIQNFVDENDFMINELSRRDLTSDDTGGLTKEGDAVAGLHVANYKAYQEQAQSYANAITDINKKLADDPYNQRYIEQKEKLVKSYQDATKAAQDEKFNTIDLMKSGYDALKNHISDLINKYQDLIDSEKDAYDYANNISEKTKTLSDLRKQLTALSGDTSEESRAKIQQLNVSLKDAEKDLKDTQYDKLISSTKDMLSDFQTDLNDSIQDIIKNLDDEFNKLITSIDEKWGTSSETVSSLMGKINYTEQFDKLLGDGGVLNGTKGVLEGIKSFCDSMWDEYDKRAKTTHTYNNTAGQNSSSGGGKTNGSSSGSGSKPKPTFIGIPAGNLTPTAYEKKKIETFISQNKLKATKKREQYGLLNRTLYDNYGKIVMTAAKWKELAEILGFKNYSSDKNSAFWKKLHNAGIKGFKKGSDGIPYDMIANLGEDGTELQYDVSKGVLKSVGQGDMIFTAEQAKTLMEFAKNPMAYKNMYTGTAFSMPSVPVNNKVDNDVNISIGDIKLEGVQDPKQLANGIKDVIKNNTGGVRSMIKEDTIGSLSKGYNSQSVKRW